MYFSVSTKIGLAPVYSTACDVAVCDWQGTITSSPVFKFAARQDKCSAAVQLDTAIEYLAPV